MLEKIWSAPLRYPKQVGAAGRAVALFGAFGLLLGALANVGTVTASAAASLGGQPPVTSIVQLWPGMPTWFIPESFAGFLLYGLLTAAGVYMVLAGNEGERIWKSF